jgi:hypothetical protein
MLIDLVKVDAPASKAPVTKAQIKMAGTLAAT